MSRSYPSVSVVIPAYNAAHLLDRSIASVLAQTRPVHEILVVDDGSTDKTAEVLARYGPTVRSFRQPNGRMAKARNRGIREATGDWIAFLDADDQWLPDKLERQLARAAQVPEAGVVFTDAWVIGSGGETLGRLLEDKGPQEGWVFDRLLSSFFVLPSATIVRRSVLLEAGLFNESMGRTEDYDLWLRLAKVTPFAMLDEPLALYERQPDSVTRDLVAAHRAHIVLYRRLLQEGLNREQRAVVEQRLRKARMGLAWELRGSSKPASLRASLECCRRYPARPDAWKLLAGSLAAGLR